MNRPRPRRKKSKHHKRGGSGNFNKNNVIAQRNKYLDKAKEAQREGDRVGAENWLQHADHFNRILQEHEDSLPKEPEGNDNKNDENTDDLKQNTSDKNIKKSNGRADNAEESQGTIDESVLPKLESTETKDSVN